MGIPLHIITCFTLADFNMVSFLVFKFDILIKMILGVGLLGFLLLGLLWASAS